MDAPPIQEKQSEIQWKQLWSLAALYGSVIIGWIAYERYQPKLLVQFNFTSFATPLVIAQAIILLITPPIAGKLGDKFRFKQGHRIPIITSGISFAGMVFMAVAFTLLSNPGEVFRWILPVLIIFWLIAMSIFTSPALSTLELFTPLDKLPRAMAILTIVANLIYSVEPVIVDIIDALGAPVTFIAGGIVVVASGYALKKNSLSLFSLSDNKEGRPIASMKLDTQRSRYFYIFFLGVVLGVATTVMFNLFPTTLPSHLQSISFSSLQNGKLLVVYMLVLSALLSWPVSNLITRLGAERAFWMSVVGIVIVMPLIFMVDAAIPLILLMVVYSFVFTLLSISSLPLAMQNSNYYEKVFCVGIFFSGVALPDGILEIILAM